MAVLRCPACGGVARGSERPDGAGSAPRRRRPLPEGGQPDNFVLDADTAERLLRTLGAAAEPR